MNIWHRVRDRFRDYPAQDDVKAVRELTAQQWSGVAVRTPTYLEGYRDHPDARDKAQMRARWLANHAAFSEAHGVLELGCGCGRNLAELRRAYPRLYVSGYDISSEGLEECRRVLPKDSWFERMNLYSLTESRPRRVADVLFTVGVLGHLEATAAEKLIRWMRASARQAVVLVEEPGYGTVAKGPRAWGARKNTGDYILWLHAYETMAKQWMRSIEVVPDHLQAPAATRLYVLRPE